MLDRETGKPLPGVKVAATAELKGGKTVPVGVLASDPQGYVSFDLDDTASDGELKKVSLSVYGNAQPTAEVTTATARSGGPQFVLALDAAHVETALTDGGLPSVQNADPLDWEISPASFARRAPLILGDGACEVPIPAHEAEYSYRFSQIVRTLPPSTGGDTSNGSAPAELGTIDALDPTTIELPSGPQPIAQGELLEFKQEWLPLGHSLGSIVYSLPLAPGERVSVAVIDWSRRDLAMRDDNVLSKEGLLHSQRRDRTIEEVVNGALKESQGGWSLLGGISSAQRASASGSVPVDGVPIDASAGSGLVGSLGGGISQSWGERDLSARSLQSLHDLTTQATNVVRSLNSTVVVQATSEERNYLETRTVANHNHCHALTVQFYEVARQLRIVTEYVGMQKVILLPFRLLEFDWQTALRYRQILEAVLLDAKLRPGFDALIRLHVVDGGAPAPAPVPAPTPAPASSAPAPSAPPSAPASPAPAAPAPTVTRYELTIESSDWNWSQTWGEVSIHVGLKDGSWPRVWRKEFHRAGGGELQKGRWTIDVTDAEAIGLDPTQIAAVKVTWQEDNAFDSWGFKAIRLRCAAGSVVHTLVDQVGSPELKRFDDSGATTQEWTHPAEPFPALPPDPDPTPTPATAVKRYELTLRTSDRNWSTTWGAVWVDVGLTDGGWRRIWMKDFHRNGGGELQKSRLDATVTEGEAIDVEFASIDRVRVSWQEDNGVDSWGFAGITLKAELGSGELKTLLDRSGSPELKAFDDSGNAPLAWVESVTAGPSPGPGPGPGPGPSPGPGPGPVPRIARYELSLSTSEWNWSTTWGAVWVRIGLKNGSWRTLYAKPAKASGGGELPKHTFVVDVTDGDAMGVVATDIERVKVSWIEDNGFDSWGFAGVTIRYATPNAGFRTLIDEHGSPELKRFDDSGTTPLDWIQYVSVPPDETPPDPRAADERLAKELLVHLKTNAALYNRAIWLLQDPSERALMLDQALAGQPELRTSIEDTPLGVSGNYVAFRWNAPLTAEEQQREDTRKATLTPKQDVVTLPTRGLFAETHLSNCSACEVRDVTRFWQWEESPIPETPAAIEGVTPGPHGQPLPQPTPAGLPPSVVSIQGAPTAPDPVGLAAALQLLGKGDAFRDMSGMKEVRELLSGLTSGAVSLAQARDLAKQAKKELDDAESAVSLGGSGSSHANGNSPTRPQSPEKILDKAQVAKHLGDQGILTEEQVGEIARDLFRADTGTPGQVVPAGWTDLADERFLKHVMNWFYANSFPIDANTDVHIDHDHFSELLGLELPGDADPKTVDRKVKFSIHGVRFTSKKTWAELTGIWNQFAELADPQWAACKKVVGGPTVQVNDVYHWDVPLPTEARIALSIAVSPLNPIVGALIMQLASRKFHVRVRDIQNPANGPFELTVQTLLDHPYGGQRAWRLSKTGNKVGGADEYLAETADFNAFHFIPDHVAEMAVHGTPVMKLWEAFLREYVRRAAGTITNDAQLTGRQVLSGAGLPSREAAAQALLKDPDAARVYAEYGQLKKELDRVLGWI